MDPLRDDRLPGLTPVVVLGVTGSIGTQTLDVAGRIGVPVVGVGARRGSDELLTIARDHPDALVGVAAPTQDERDRFTDELGSRVRFGPEAMTWLAAAAPATVINGIVGAAGLPSSVAALRAGNRLGLANKESLVAGGSVVAAAMRDGGGQIVPVDSEHSALAQCLEGEDVSAVRRLILSASGGPFRGRSHDDLVDVSPGDALRHPTWEMGPRISIDSATLMNKAFEVIEAHHLFGFDYDAIDVVVHPQSIVHAIVEFVDGSLKAHLGSPDMRVPIQYAITYPERHRGPLDLFDLTAQPLTFEEPDLDAFPALRLGYEAGRAGGSAPAVLNAADEVAVHAFLEGRIGFTSIPVVVERTLGDIPVRTLDDPEQVMEIDQLARGVAREHLGGSC